MKIMTFASTFLLLFTCWINSSAQNETQLTRKIVNGISSKHQTEFSPTVSADGRTMIFESSVGKDNRWELFQSKMNESGNWAVPFPLTSINEKCHFLAGPCLSYDGNTLYYTAFIENVTKSEDIFYSVRLGTNQMWSEPKSIGAPINTDEAYEGFPSISADGNSLYFIRVNADNPYDRKTKENCFVIYVSHKQPSGVWGEPEVLPSPINLGCERDPRIMADNYTLIFSSIRPGGKGKYDLYQSRKQTDGSWTEPLALDFINEEDNDQSPSIAASGEIIYFYSLKDIYSIVIPKEYRQMINVTVQGFLLDNETKKPVNATIEIRNEKNNKLFAAQSNPTDGQYSLVLAAGEKYRISYVSKEYLAEEIEFDLTNQETYMEVKKDVLFKSTYDLDLTVIDADTRKPVSAWVNFYEQESVFKDSVKNDHYPLQLALSAPIDYTLTVAKQWYSEISIPWKFDPFKMKPKMTYTVELLHEKINQSVTLTNIVTNQKLKFKITFVNEQTKEVIIANVDETVLLRKGDRYQIITDSDKGYFFASTSIIAGEGQPDSKNNYVTNMKITPIAEGAELTLSCITFPSNSYELGVSSFLELDKVKELMDKNSGIHIEISAHTDDIGDDTDNQRLSEKRALNVVSYLMNKGAAIQKLRPVGFGESKPLAINNNDENRARNRRVELRVLKMF